MSFLGWILTHKLLIFFIAGTVAFGISTIVLGVDNSNLRSDLDEAKGDSSTMSKYRLASTAKPSLYDLYLKPDLTSGLFSGEVSITVTLSGSPKEIVLHSSLLTINKVEVNGYAAKHVLDATYETLTITDPNDREFTNGENVVYIEFSGDMKKRIVGLYTSNYTSASGESRSIATSKFEPTFARQAFPCFDEPNLKARFKVRLLKPKDDNYIALSNYPSASVTDTQDGQIVSFKETVPMSTYLACFIVSDFKHTETTFNNSGVEIPFKVFSSPEQLSKTKYAAEVGKKVIEYYVDYFKLEYPLPKLDMVAIPDFVSGAMEHWGLVTYRETALLYTNTTHSSANKQRVATVIAHELAHSWFGNLVTMNWWNDLWLNEGFASYIEYKGVAAVEDTWEMMDQFLIDDLHPVLSLDATLGSHPIIVTVETPNQITEVFDTISYNKGASILRMLENTVGSENFRNGVTKYLERHTYGNAVTQNLLNQLQPIVGSELNITSFIDTYTVQMGYPILTVTVDGDKYTFTQKRFLKDPDAKYDGVEPYNYKWTVPITYVTDLGKSDTYTLFEYNKDSVTIEKPSNAKWIKFNYDQVGYYRVNYPEAEWSKLIENYKSLSTADRTHLLEESFSIAEAGLLKYSIPLDLTKMLVDEINYIPWSVGSTMLQKIKGFLSDSVEEKFDNYIRNVTDKAYGQLTWTESDDDSHLKRLARVVILGLACAVDHEDCLKEVKSKFDEWIASPATVVLSQDLRGLIYRYGMKTADEATWEKLFEVFKAETDSNEKLKLLYGLASINDTAILQKLLNLAADETYIRNQDYFTFLSYVSANKLGTSIVWDYVRNNWEKLVDRFGLSERNLGRAIPTVTQRFKTEDRLNEMKEFFAKYPDAGAGATARVQALETVSNNIKWVNRYKAVVEDWISNVS
ncbi:aminopeptidase A isoform X3 [Aethina tumida]|uniref:aminopeptidase A isoform X3 n=1 Tax=Aethina tumida TaxID=116153 RepID=UPI00214765B8|nr:aminopeptidase A isoform X3 [Aethina tumida]